MIPKMGSFRALLHLLTAKRSAITEQGKATVTKSFAQSVFAVKNFINGCGEKFCKINNGSNVFIMKGL